MTINLRNKFSLLKILPIATMGRVCAHALWIETSTIGKTGEKQFVKIVYSEPEDKPEKIIGWHFHEKMAYIPYRSAALPETGTPPPFMSSM